MSNSETGSNESSFGNRLGVDRGSSKNGNQNEQKGKFGFKKGEDRPQITESMEDGMYWGVDIRSNIVSKNQLRSNISEVLKSIFNDYTGCNIFIDPTDGQFKLIAFFGPHGLNKDAKYKAFEQDLEGKLKSSNNPLFEIATSNAAKMAGKIYYPTREGAGILSDFVPATNFDKDNDGWIKNFNKFFMEVSNTPQMYNGYYVSYFTPNSQEYVWAAVPLDITAVLRLCKDRINKTDKSAHQYDYMITATNTAVVQPVTMYTSYSAQEADFFVEIKEIDSTEMSKILAQTGVYGMPNFYARQY